jgi:hypothetical protein
MLNVPAEYRALYLELRRQVIDFRAAVDARWDGSKGPTLYGAELIPADNYVNFTSNTYYTQSVIPFLDRLEALECRCVKFQLGFPVLHEPFWTGWVVPNGYGQNKFAALRTQYERLVADCHVRGINVIAQSQHMDLARGAAWNVAGYYATLNWAQYQAARKANVLAAAAIGLTADDYLVVQSEPDNEALNTGQSSLVNVTADGLMIQDIVTAIAAAGLDVPAIAAGCGSWYASYIEHVQMLCTLLLVDVIDLHIYPITPAAIGGSHWARLITLADMALAAGKGVGCSESWLNKVGAAEAGTLPNDVAFARSVYSFWELLDEAFRAAMVELGHALRFEYQSASFPRQFLANVPYTVGPVTPAQLEALENQATAAAIQAGTFTHSGLDYKRLIEPAAAGFQLRSKSRA